MKIRNGFISNSSSSSFIIGVKGKDLKSVLKEKLFVPVHPFSFLLEEIIDTISVCCRYYTYSSEKDYKNICKKEDLGEDSNIIDLLKKGYIVHSGYFTNDDSAVESLLYDSDINYVSDDLVIIHHRG